MKFSESLVLAGLCSVVVVPASSHAVIVYNSGAGGQQTAAPTDPTLQTAWSAIGLVDISGTGKYYVGTAISPSTFITAQHILTATKIVYGAKTYNVTAVHNDPSSDLVIYSVDTSGGGFSSYVPLYTGSSEVGKSMFVAGRGVSLGTTIQTGTQTNGWKWATPYTSSASSPVSWGTDTVGGLAIDSNNTTYIKFNFAKNNSSCAIVDKDSGGPVLVKDSDNVWKLAGINKAVAPSYSQSATNHSDAFSGAIYDSYGLYYTDFSTGAWTYAGTNNGSTTVARSESYATRVSDRYSWAQTYVPEPTTLAITLAGAIVLGYRRRKGNDQSGEAGRVHRIR